jgi:DNA-directed RNA polymerase subunit RPC12/RpoP
MSSRHGKKGYKSTSKNGENDLYLLGKQAATRDCVNWIIDNQYLECPECKSSNSVHFVGPESDIKRVDIVCKECGFRDLIDRFRVY